MTPGTVTDHRSVLGGVMPRYLQQWLTIGVAIVMARVMALRHPSRGRRPTNRRGRLVGPNQQRIEEYQRRIQEQA